jgi:hypothetical protein
MRLSALPRSASSSVPIFLERGEKVMAVKSRAFVIAIERYDRAVGMANTLPSTNAGAQEFYDWLVGVKKVAPADIYACAEPSIPWRTSGTTRPEILAALGDLVVAGQDATSDLFFFFAGHGFSYEDGAWEKPIDVLVASEYVRPGTSGGACLKLQEVQEKLYQAMGPGNHFYFIEACRNPVSHKQINVLETGLVFEPSLKKKPNRYTLYSTPRGEVSVVGSGFARALVSGLKGGGRAKGWKGNKMYVTFDLLCDYVEQRVEGGEIEPDIDGPIREGHLIELQPIPTSKCEVVVKNAAADDHFTLIVHSNFGRQGPFEFRGPNYSVDLKPFDYELELKHATAAVVQISPSPDEALDLYESRAVEFEKQSAPEESPPIIISGGGSPAGESVPVVGVNVLADGLSAQDDAPAGEGLRKAKLTLRGSDIEDAELSLENVMTGQIRRKQGATLGNRVSPGTYIAKLREGSTTVSRRKIVVKPGKRVEVDLLEHPPSRVREGILAVVGGNPLARVAKFSEQLQPTANWDLGLWLSLLGAERIVASSQGVNSSKINTLPLASFDDAEKDDSFVYVLGGFEKSEGEFVVGLGAGKDVAWEPFDAVEGLKGIHHRRFHASPGAHLLSLKLPGRVPVTYATYCLPNRVTLLILAQDERGRMTFNQFLLPMRRLFRHLPSRVLYRLEENPLQAVRQISIAQARFARKRPIRPEKATVEEAAAWTYLINNKWLDPVMSLIAAYDLIRHNGLEHSKAYLPGMIRNLRRYFGGIPDIDAVERLLKHKNVPLPPASPLLLEGVLAFGEQQQSVLPLPPDKLDYGSPWTKWVGAVNDVESPDQSSSVGWGTPV